MTNFQAGEDTGQRLRNKAEYLTVDVTNFLLPWSTSSQMPVHHPVGLVLIVISNLFQFQLF